MIDWLSLVVLSGLLRAEDRNPGVRARITQRGLDYGRLQQPCNKYMGLSFQFQSKAYVAKYGKTKREPKAEIAYSIEVFNNKA